MKQTKTLGATTLAGALLFTSFGTANADQVVNDSNVKDYAEQAIGSKYTSSGKIISSNYKDKGEYYELNFGGEKDNGSATAKVYKDGRVVGHSPQEPTKDIVYAEAQQQHTQDNNHSSQATDNNNTAQNNTQEQSQAKVLPETGEESSNATLVTMIASVLLAAGSLLTFKRFSKEK
ncbi:LPXTG cell wall anchor domain-containing protein [Staphylococcus warneri]|jgi:LPXTG-motif cell wall-anchored protein|uniref:LPXTG cell wall anchor domain-containing protein n=1 Tax=Staphylococcus warneri TaxID=1292 RepID=UPI0036506E3F